MFKKLRLNLPIEHPLHAEVVRSRLKLFVCPSVDVPDDQFTITTASNTALVVVGPSSYAATCGPDDSETTAEKGLGVFYRNKKARFADITDGTTYTVFLGDRAWNQTNGT